MAKKSLVEWALYYSQYFPVYPLAKDSIVPLKGSHGHLDATQDQKELVRFFTELAPAGNLAASFIDTDYFVLDVDRKTPKEDGMVSLNKIMPQGADLGDPVIVKTKSGKGFHLYYRTTADIKHEIDWLGNVDILKNSCILPPTKAPSTSTGEMGEYQFVKGTLDDVEEPPKWLLNAILDSQKERSKAFTLSSVEATNKKKYTAILLEEFLKGVETGSRSNWITQQVGRLLYLGMDSEAAYQWIHILNENFVSPPLPDREVNAAFKSILKKELAKEERSDTTA